MAVHVSVIRQSPISDLQLKINNRDLRVFVYVHKTAHTLFYLIAARITDSNKDKRV